MIYTSTFQCSTAIDDLLDLEVALFFVAVHPGVISHPPMYILNGFGVRKHMDKRSEELFGPDMISSFNQLKNQWASSLEELTLSGQQTESGYIGFAR